jgi:hypothetical protein
MAGAHHGLERAAVVTGQADDMLLAGHQALLS